MRRYRRLIAGVLVGAGIVVGGIAYASSARAESEEASPDPVLVIEVGDPIDQRLIDFVMATIDSNAAHLFVLKIDSPGVSSGDLTDLFATMTTASAPVVAWIGPAPAVAFGGAAYVANHADIRSGAPGAEVGYLDPAVLRGDDPSPSVHLGEASPEDLAASVAVLRSAVETVGAAGDNGVIPGFVDRLDPALGQLLLALDGTQVVRADTGVTFTISTAEVIEVDGVETVVVTRPVRFIKPGLLDRFLRLGARPETAFLFLVFGLAFAVFEFYAAGTGLMAFVAALSLIVSGYGMATLPMWWPAVAMVVGGVAVEVWGFVHNRIDWRAVVGTLLVFGGGLAFTLTRPAYPPVLWMVVLATVAATVFIWYALTTVVRSRFATPTIGRADLLGRRCLVVEPLDPFGVVVVDGARWHATADRGVEIASGVPVEIVGVTGLVLEVDPIAPLRREEIP